MTVNVSSYQNLVAAPSFLFLLSFFGVGGNSFSSSEQNMTRPDTHAFRLTGEDRVQLRLKLEYIQARLVGGRRLELRS